MKLKLVTISLTNQDSSTIKDYVEAIKGIITNHPVNTIFVLPEYCWGDISNEEFFKASKTIYSTMQPQQYIVLGTYPLEIEEKLYNVAIFADENGEIARRQKSSVLSDEAKNKNVNPGNNSGTIRINGINIAIAICADIWDNILLNNLIRNQEADVLLVPAFTIVPNGLSNYAKNQWKSLAIVRSREYLIPIAIADHSSHGDEYEVGHGTCIVNPSWKSDKMNSIDDFLSLPTNNVAEQIIEFNKIKDYREYRINKGLYQKKSSSDN